MSKNEKEIWAKLRAWFLDAIDLNIYNEYLKNAFIKEINFENYNIVIKSKGFGLEILENECSNIEEYLETILKRKAKIHFITVEELNNEITIKKPRTSRSIQSFDNFIVGESNKGISNEAKKIAENPYESKYNPFFIYGATGLGKTHLIRAMSERLKENGYKVYINTAIEFRSQYGKAAKEKNFSNMEKIRDNDVFIIDDINLITKNKSHETMNYFFSILSYFMEEGKQVVVTADTHPNEIVGVEERIRSRFLAGLTMNLKKPDDETAKSIIKFFLEQKGMDLNDDIIVHIIKNYGNNVREMNGLINHLYVAEIQENIDMKKITIDEFNKTISIPVNISNKLGDIKSLFMSICNYLKVSPDEMSGSLKVKTISSKRRQIIWLMRQISPNSTLKDIGSVLGGRDHSTINSSLKKINNAIDSDKTLMNSLMKHKKNIINSM